MHFDDRMDGSQGVGAVGANNSSDFVSCPSPLSSPNLICCQMQFTKLIMARFENFTSRNAYTLSGSLLMCRLRMLEDPTYSSVVRWGDDGDSFVVLEVGTRRNEKYINNQVVS